jgi:hypothetical protein
LARNPAAGAKAGKRRVLLSAATDSGGWSVIYPEPAGRATRPGREELLDARGSRAKADEPQRSAVGVFVGYARCWTDKRDLAAQRQTLRGLGVSDERVYLDHGMSGRNRKRPGLEQALAAVRGGDTLVVSKLDRLARSVPDARAIGDALTAGRWFTLRRALLAAEVILGTISLAS